MQTKTPRIQRRPDGVLFCVVEGVTLLVVPSHSDRSRSRWWQCRLEIEETSQTALSPWVGTPSIAAAIGAAAMGRSRAS